MRKPRLASILFFAALLGAILGACKIMGDALHDTSEARQRSLQDCW